MSWEGTVGSIALRVRSVVVVYCSRAGVHTLFDQVVVLCVGHTASVSAVLRLAYLRTLSVGEVRVLADAVGVVGVMGVIIHRSVRWRGVDFDSSSAAASAAVDAEETENA